MKPPPYLTSPWPEPSGRRPAVALHALAARLRERGITDLYGAACARFGVLSLPSVSVWSDGRVLWWRTAGREMTWPATDPGGAAGRLTEEDR